MTDYSMVKYKLTEPRIGTGYTFSERSEFHGFLVTPKMVDLISLPGLYREVETIKPHPPKLDVLILK